MKERSDNSQYSEYVNKRKYCYFRNKASQVIALTLFFLRTLRKKKPRKNHKQIFKTNTHTPAKQTNKANPLKTTNYIGAISFY